MIKVEISTEADFKSEHKKFEPNLTQANIDEMINSYRKLKDEKVKRSLLDSFLTWPSLLGHFLRRQYMIYYISTNGFLLL
jgi:hypothetical protein